MSTMMEQVPTPPVAAQQHEEMMHLLHAIHERMSAYEQAAERHAHSVVEEIRVDTRQLIMFGQHTQRERLRLRSQETSMPATLPTDLRAEFEAMVAAVHRQEAVLIAYLYDPGTFHGQINPVEILTELHTDQTKLLNLVAELRARLLQADVGSGVGAE